MERHNYHVYVLTNSSKNVLYVGVTNNLPQRLVEHWQNRGTTQSFVGRYYCYWLVYYEHHVYINNAIAREKELKSRVRAEKNKIISGFNPTWLFLNKEICGGWPPPADAKSR